MKRLFVFLVLFFVSLNSQALEIEIIDESGFKVFKVDYEVLSSTTVGDLSVEVFEQFKVPFDGNAIGMHSIMGIEPRVDIISKKEMKAYGWCFEVDGIAAETLPHETPISAANKSLVWYYAYAHYLAGEWIAQCIPAME